jgi:head-tail adaptor
MRPGELNQRVSVRYVESSYDPTSGDVTHTVKTRGDVWADVQYKSGEVASIGDSMLTQEVRDYLVTVRRPVFDIKESDTIVWRGLALGIKAIADEGPRARMLKLEVSSASGDATVLNP